MHEWTITKPGGATIVFDGFISKLGGENPMKEKMMTKLSIKVTGKPAYIA